MPQAVEADSVLSVQDKLEKIDLDVDAIIS